VNLIYKNTPDSEKGTYYGIKCINYIDASGKPTLGAIDTIPKRIYDQVLKEAQAIEAQRIRKAS
jgi:hypothetical protein